MKKTILTILITAIICITGTVIASNYLASEIAYKDTTVENALNDLYARSNANEYHVSSNSIIPTETEQVLETSGKRLDGNLTIGAIPDLYKKLNNHTTVDETKLLNGVTAYNEYGEFITGNISTDCVKGTYQHVANSQINITTPFKATMLLMYLRWSDKVYYIHTDDNGKLLQYRGDIGDTGDTTSDYEITSTYVKSKFSTTSTKYTQAYTVIYMYCK